MTPAEPAAPAGLAPSMPTVGVSTVVWYDNPLPVALERAASLVPLVEIFSVHNHSLLDPANLRAATRVSVRFTVHAPWVGLDLASVVDEARAAAVREHDRQLSRAAEIGAEVYVVHIDGSGDREPGWAHSAMMAAFSRSAEELLASQERSGVRVAVENLPDPRTSLFTAPGLDLGGLGLALDAGHAALAGTLKDFLRDGVTPSHFHLHDNQGPSDGRDYHLALGRGTVDVPAVLKAAREAGAAVVLELVEEAAVPESLTYLAGLHDPLLPRLARGR